MLLVEIVDSKNDFFFCVFVTQKMVRVEIVEISSQVWKTCILAVVLYPHMGWDTRIELVTFGTTIRRSNQLS